MYIGLPATLTGISTTVTMLCQIDPQRYLGTYGLKCNNINNNNNKLMDLSICSYFIDGGGHLVGRYYYLFS